MTFSRDLQLCPECIQFYLVSTFGITFYHYPDNFSTEESALFSILMSSIWTSDTLKQTTLYGGKNASSLYEISEAFFPPICPAQELNCSDRRLRETGCAWEIPAAVKLCSEEKHWFFFLISNHLYSSNAIL